MFRHEGPARSDRDNRRLAAYLALIGGFVNSCGFVLSGIFTSHVTGNVGRFASDVVSGDVSAAVAALALITTFFVGAFIASMIVESNVFGWTPNAYGVALVIEACTLAAFLLNAHVGNPSDPRHQDAKALLLCAAMGMQNSLVTRISGSVVRTTHLTGVVTDLGIEAARWFRFWRRRTSEALQVRLSFGRNPPERPNPARLRLLLTIASSFFCGAIAGSASGVAFQADAMIVPTVAVVLGAAYAINSGRTALGSSGRPNPAAGD